MPKEVSINFPDPKEWMNEKFVPLLDCKDRWMILYGSRASSKSTFVAQMLVLRCLSMPFFRCLSLRLVADSIKESSYRQICDVIETMGVSKLFKMTVSPLKIECLNGNYIIFNGLDHPEKLKSMSDITCLHWEEDIPETYTQYVTVSNSLRTMKADYIQEIFSINPVIPDYRNNWFWQMFFEGETNKSFRKEFVSEDRVTGKKTTQWATIHHCFIGSTKVLTEFGWKRIDSIKVGDRVITRQGLKLVTHTYNNGKRRVKTYLVGDKEITCTPDHKFYNNGKWIPISSLLGETTLMLYDDINNIWKEQKLFITELDSSNTKQNPIISHGLKENQLDCIDMSGNVKMVIFPTDFKYITKMVTNSTTILRILKCCQQKNTSKSTKHQNRKKKGWLGQKVRLEKKKFQREIIDESVKLLEKRSVMDVKPYSNLTNSIQIKDFVLTDVNVEQMPEREEVVYDLTIEDCHEFIVEGILVSNSTWRDNRFLPDTYALQMEMLSRDQWTYMTNNLGLWADKTNGGNFYKKFDAIKNIKNREYDPELPLFVSIDFNVKPWFSILIGQIVDKELYIIDEMPIKHPNNYTREAIKIFAKKYKHHVGRIFVTGDAAGYQRDTSQEKGYDNWKIVFEELSNFNIIDKTVKQNPSVEMRGQFMNSVFGDTYNGITIYINSNCVNLINDLSLGGEAPDGTKLKQRVKDKETGDVYEKYHHFSDCLDYMVVSIFTEDYTTYKNPNRFDPIFLPRIHKNAW